VLHLYIFTFCCLASVSSPPPDGKWHPLPPPPLLDVGDVQERCGTRVGAQNGEKTTWETAVGTSKSDDYNLSKTCCIIFLLFF
jgi:hypothetical protein